jgi:hypothetical protein
MEEERGKKGKSRRTSGQSALTNSMLCEMIQTAPPQSRIATDRPPRASRSKLNSESDASDQQTIARDVKQREGRRGERTSW